MSHKTAHSDLEEMIEERLEALPHFKKNHLQPQKNSLKWQWLIGIGVTVGISALCYLGIKLYKLEKNQKKTHLTLKKINSSVTGIGSAKRSAIAFPDDVIPHQLRSVPLAETYGVILGTKKIEIRNVLAPYNPSIFKKENEPGYHVVFRYDQFNSSHFPDSFFSYIGSATLDDQFQQTTEEFRKIDTHSPYSEDPRVVKIGKQHYLVYNDVQPHSPYCRSMRIAPLNLKDFSIGTSTNLDLHLQHVEKNWAPFEYLDESGESHCFFEYNLSPHKILELPNPQINSFNHLIFPEHPSPLRLPWKDIWGHPRGGTPAQKIGEEYLSFFHTSIKDSQDMVWYLMGAYTFEAHPPFRITAVSKFPLLFNGIYDTPHLNTASTDKRVIFPMGFVMEKQGDKDVIQLSCGENDAGIKIVTLDKEALLKNMIKTPL